MQQRLWLRLVVLLAVQILEALAHLGSATCQHRQQQLQLARRQVVKLEQLLHLHMQLLRTTATPTSGSESKRAALVVGVEQAALVVGVKQAALVVGVEQAALDVGVEQGAAKELHRVRAAVAAVVVHHGWHA